MMILEVGALSSRLMLPNHNGPETSDLKIAALGTHSLRWISGRGFTTFRRLRGHTRNSDKLRLFEIEDDLYVAIRTGRARSGDCLAVLSQPETRPDQRSELYLQCDA